MKRTEIKRRPLSDTVLANLEAEQTEYRELDGNGLYFRVKPDGNKSVSFRLILHSFRLYFAPYFYNSFRTN